MQALRSSELPLVYQLEGIGLVTSLPYIDEPVDKGMMKQIKKMISSESESRPEGAPGLDMQGLDTELETPQLDSCMEEGLGKRVERGENEGGEELKRDKYSETAINVERMKERYF